MELDELWKNFETSGKVDDYLKYKMSNVVQSEDIDEIIQSEGNSN